MYCQSLNMCSDLYAHYLYELGDSSYYPQLDAPKLCTNILFGMYHSGTADHNKNVIVKSMSDAIKGHRKSCVCYSCPWDGSQLGCIKQNCSLRCTS